ncbi:MAG: xanthine dehydrogenase family protein subunit M [Deltaproteobacteria bacterium]|nr:xanthine dehydrogenase family protein subunit M [Deltaproteobacteria bacterium]
MEPFGYIAAADEKMAIDEAPRGTFIAGGTNMVDYMRLGVIKPTTLIDVSRLPLTNIEAAGDGVKIGALVRNSDLAYHPLIQQKYPVLAEALLSGASPQIRNMATTGGNILQRTRCPYFRDMHYAQCNKRQPGSGCAAIGGFNRSHAVLGGSPACIATNPSDMNVAMAALDATVHVHGPSGERDIAFVDFHTLPGDHPEVETVLQPGELITYVTLPAVTGKQHYLKVRDRASFAFALASAAVVLDVQGGTIHGARVALGGVGTKPWRAKEAEAALVGQAPSPAVFAKAADAALAGAKGQPTNAFKIELAKRTLVRALTEVSK